MGGGGGGWGVGGHRILNRKVNVIVTEGNDVFSSLGFIGPKLIAVCAI